MKLLYLMLIFSLILSACGTSPEQIKKAIEQTKVVEIAATSQAATPTIQPTPIPTSTPDKYKEVRQEFYQAIKEALLQYPMVDKVLSITADQGKVEIEWISTSTLKMEQVDYSFLIVAPVAQIFTKLSPDELVPVTNGKPFMLKVITLSKDNRYKYVTEFSYDMLKRLLQAVANSDYKEYEMMMEEANGRFE